MITFKKEKQYLSVIKTVKTSKLEKCIGIYDLSKKEWCKDAPFVKREMNGQQYNDFLRIIVEKSAYYEIIVDFCDFINSVLNIDFSEINNNLVHQVLIHLLDEGRVKFLKTSISKNREKIKNCSDILSFLSTLDISSFKGQLGKREFIEELYGYSKMNGKASYCHFFNDITGFLTNYINMTNEYIGRGFDENEIEKMYRIYFIQGFQMFGGLDKVADYISNIKEMGVEYPTGNFIMNYRKICGLYKDFSDKKSMEIFLKSQTEIDLNFSWENYKIFVPTTRKDLEKYGNIFGNCLNGWEWETQLKNGKRKVVIIFKNERPHICCDIEKTKIVQYLLEHNEKVSNKEDVLFKQEFQNYLSSLGKTIDNE